MIRTQSSEATPRILKSPRPGCENCAIRERAVCAYCGPAELTQLDKIKSYRHYDKGAEIVAEGERSPFVASIVTGVVSLSKTLPDGRRQMVGLQFPSDFVGGAFRSEAAYDATAASEVTLCQFDRAAFDTIMAQMQPIKTRLLEITLDDLDAAREWLTLLGQKNAREKVCTFLLMIARRSGRPEQDGMIAELPITRSEIGEYLGLTIETVSRQLSKLKAARLIDFQTTRRFVIPDIAALAAEAGDTEDHSVL